MKNLKVFILLLAFSSSISAEVFATNDRGIKSSPDSSKAMEPAQQTNQNQSEKEVKVTLKWTQWNDSKKLWETVREEEGILVFDWFFGDFEWNVVEFDVAERAFDQKRELKSSEIFKISVDSLKEIHFFEGLLYNFFGSNGKIKSSGQGYKLVSKSGAIKNVYTVGNDMGTWNDSFSVRGEFGEKRYWFPISDVDKNDRYLKTIEDMGPPPSVIIFN